MSDNAARQRGKYGWAKKMIRQFIAAAMPWATIDCPDEFGRNQMQVYYALYKAITRDFYDQPIEVKILAEAPNQVCLHRLDIDED